MKFVQFLHTVVSGQWSVACMLYFLWWNRLPWIFGNLQFIKMNYSDGSYWFFCSSNFFLYLDFNISFICYAFLVHFFFPFESSSTWGFLCDSFIVIVFQELCFFFSYFCLIRVWKAHHMGLNGWSRSKLCNIWEAWGSVALYDTLFVWFLVFPFSFSSVY